MNILPLIFRKIQPFKMRPRYIVLHGTQCLSRDDQALRIDQRNKFQISFLKRDAITIKGLNDVPYHYVLENMGGDYYPIMMHPLSSPVEYYSSMKFNNKSIHICMFGNYNVDMARPRLYEVLTYRVLAPLMFWFRIPQSNIFLHSELDKEFKDCPGEMFYKDILLGKLNKHLLRK
ncbi:N-acetylmuramoyl-L-alanine amidase [bacterium]|jgi:hypothetical protein|nr:N-acetylmuramoyl-L-alanine amidase [bacterium]